MNSLSVGTSFAMGLVDINVSVGFDIQVQFTSGFEYGFAVLGLYGEENDFLLIIILQYFMVDSRKPVREGRPGGGEDLG